MISFRKNRRESELSLMSRSDDRKGSVISLSSLRRTSLDGGDLYLTTTQLQRDMNLPIYLQNRRPSYDPPSRRPSEDIQNRRPSQDPPNDDETYSSNFSPNFNKGPRASIELPAITKTIVFEENSVVDDDEITIQVPSHLGIYDNKQSKNDDRRVSTASMVFGEGKSDFKENNAPLMKRIWINIIVMSIAFMLLFSSITSLASLQSSLHSDNLGVVGLSLTFSTVAVSCIVVPRLMIQFIGYKWTVTVSMLGAATWMLTNIWAVPASVIPGSIILGLSWAPLWTAHSAYTTNLAKKYAMVTSVSTEDAVTKFFGVFYMLFLTAPVWGNLISAAILGGFSGDSPPPFNVTQEEHEEILREMLQYCGAGMCPDQEIPLNATFVGLVRPTDHQITLMVGIMVGITAVGALVTAIFVDRETSPYLQLPAAVIQMAAQGNNDDDEDRPLKEIVLSTLKQIIRKKQCLLFPISAFVGLEQSFFLADVTSAFIGCALGVRFISIATICFGLVGGTFALIVGRLVLTTGRMPIFAITSLLHLGLMIFLLVWRIDPGHHIVLFFMLASLWGLCDCVFQSQINSFYGALFSDNSESAFAAYRMFESIGFILGYAYSGFLCVYVKLYILMSVLVISNIGYFTVEIWVKLKNKAKNENNGDKINNDNNNAKTGNDVTNTTGSVDTKEEVRKAVKKSSASKRPSLETTLEVPTVTESDV